MFNRIKDGMYWDRAWKLVEGCTPVSEGCAHCWSARETHMRAKNPNDKIRQRNRGLTTRDGVFNGGIMMRQDNLDLPLTVKKPTAFAVWNDLFHEDVPFEFIRKAFDVMWAAEHHLYFLLTKRPMNMMGSLCQLEIEAEQEGQDWPLPNVWLGVTAENQQQADQRIPVLLQIPAARRYVSVEPMLDMVDLFAVKAFTVGPCSGGGESGPVEYEVVSNIDWVICGGESGPGARPMHPVWVRDLEAQCRASHVPFFFKQWGEWSPENVQGHDTAVQSGIDGVDPYVMVRVGKTAAGRILDGQEYLEIPEGYCGDCSPSDLCPDVCPQGGKRV